MKTRACVVGFIVIVAAVAGVLYLVTLDDGGGEHVTPFDNEGRYNSTLLNNMGVIYENRSDIMAWNNGYSETDVCPWGAIHNGLDYMFYNNSPVIAAGPGFVEEINIRSLENTTIYGIGVKIRFNETILIEYGFEGEGNETLRDQQLAMLDVQVGDWVEKGDLIGNFLTPVATDHVHFTVYKNYVGFCPRLVMGEDDYNEIMILVHSFHPTWELCYLP
jgi:murein DD-endopeptidase MepM/ murein hydrolase activator NlpD